MSIENGGLGEGNSIYFQSIVKTAPTPYPLPEGRGKVQGAAHPAPAKCAFDAFLRVNAVVPWTLGSQTRIHMLERNTAMPKILIIEDDPTINSLLYDALTEHSYECTCAYSGTEGLLQIRSGQFDLILLDLMLPGLSGDMLLREIKPACQTPVIVLSAKDELDSKVDLLHLGAEDYMTKPFALKELFARMDVQLRRHAPQAGHETGVLCHGILTLCRDTLRVQVGEGTASLTKHEFRILELLVSHPNRVFTKQEIYDYAWEEFYMGEDKTINVHVSNIRKKLAALTETECIETVWGIGFRLSEAL